jgi:hypothetical protein
MKAGVFRARRGEVLDVLVQNDLRYYAAAA